MSRLLQYRSYNHTASVSDFIQCFRQRISNYKIFTDNRNKQLHSQHNVALQRLSRPTLTYQRLRRLNLRESCDLSAPLGHQVRGVDGPLQA